MLKSHQNHTSRSFLFAALVAVVGTIVMAGPLNPPAGPVTGTFKTLTEVEPRIAVNATNTPGDADSLFKITQPGSYYLIGSITGVVGKHGIEIAASGVTLDLNGFDLAGVAGMGTFDGVTVSIDQLRGINVRNGTVRDWGDAGVDLGFVSYGCVVNCVRVADNAGMGINGGVACTIQDCTAAFNGQSGIRANNGSSIARCSLYQNVGNGIQINNGCTISACSIYQNSLDGILAGIGCRITDTSAYSNLGDGIQIGEGSSVSGCTVNNNDGSGVNASDNCVISHVNANFNDVEGISVVGNGSRVSDSACSKSGANGIHCLGNDNLVIHNICTGSGRLGAFAGIRANGQRNRIEDNHCIAGDKGIEVLLIANIVLRNTCKSNAVNWSIASTNYVATIVIGSTSNSAISGNTYSGNLGSTDPNANFTE